MSIAKLWVHENNRVFGDRLINQTDRDLLLSWEKDGYKESLKLTDEQVFEHGRIIFGDFMDGIDSDHRPYKEIPDLKRM